jgi:MFS family permease
MLSEDIVMTSTHESEIKKTKYQFLRMITGEYLITGFFWVFITVGSQLLSGEESKDKAGAFFVSLLVLMFSNGIWEILTGWYADKFKRQYSMTAGFVACLLGFCLMGIAPLVGGQVNNIFSPMSLVWNAGISIWSLGPALLSGAREAWLVDRCNFFSQEPPEDVSDVFKKAAAYGIILKSVGALICFLIFLGKSDVSSESHGALLTPGDKVAFVLSAVFSAVLSATLVILSLRLREEYWSHPKYQTNESLFSFVGRGAQDLWKTPYRWFTLSYVGAMSLTYVLSPTIWPYMVDKANRDRLLQWAIALIVAELIGSVLSRPLSQWIDRIKHHQLGLPVASVMYLVPILCLWIFGRGALLTLLIVAAFSFRAANASVFGSLNTIGQLAIKSDERRASLLSMSSAISSFLMAGVFLIFSWLAYKSRGDLAFHIERFWYFVPLPLIFLLVAGGYLVARPRPGAQ